VDEIDSYGITNALHMAIVRGLRQWKAEFSTLPLHLFIDGKSDFNLKKRYPSLQITTIVNGDDKVKEISMASIIAKVSRDRIMSTLPAKYRKYAFSQHKGYGTALHREKIEQYGPSDMHRKLFLKTLFPHHQVQRKLPEKF
jgi:ribonuclease HII